MSTQKNNKKTKGSPDRVDCHVGARIKAKRVLLGVSQKKLADALGVSFQQIQKYERGLNRVHAGRLYEVSNFFDVPLHYFFEEYEDVSDSLSALSYPSHKFSYNEDEVSELIDTYYSLEDKGLRKSLLVFMKSMAR